MDLETQKKQIEDLLQLLVSQDRAVRKRSELIDKYEQGLEAAPKKRLPPAPFQPNAPRKPSKPKHVEVDGMVNPVLYLFGMGLFVSFFKKKQKKEAEEKNRQMDAEYAEKMAQYERDYAQWQKDLDAYTKAYAKWQDDVKKKTDENITKYKKDNAGVHKQVKELDEELAVLESQIAASTILSSKDKNLDVVLFVSDKLGSGRADSIMMALNMYDAEKRQEAQFRAQLQMDAFNRQMETDRRKRWEAEQERAQWSHNRQMEEYAKQTRDYERQQAKDLEEIRKAAERK